MARHKNVQWNCGDEPVARDLVQIAVLMDIRDELQLLNRVLYCPNFMAIPRKLDAIIKNTKKKRRRPVVIGGQK